MAKFRKKPVVIDAVQWTGDNVEELEQFLGSNFEKRGDHEPRCLLFIETLEGTMRADPGDWIIKGVKGEFYPCKPDVFQATYESVE